ncbi:flagellar assembly protein FliW [Alkalihalobacillus alcalophilus ATCC 27647 = CGMCC 1.3604]|uniref:Flagellar assembly factor FliW n=1 Tax=Alkalihalobacillus alcalophilus ATCC 27647 = CGMCC 1.3604 TaxID=1218173 RepID=A0A094WK93_ALKAL|nr:flagellar assembly protein FliW [Alkalihalobacillus alcalophilus]KGA97236.1 flagellar assembly protein FliW [Alkalihalobacillus alcalophilus ATCC 27647 = CGMCC 1.3604]MED1561518.1 flagellar assembly protein FliW [Alkalihalobacillus alcalophilus]THG89527.1 flagellar assembly protein FliW [Alkalihalobacillus alcalophilus ATCC 27647 = CGMCC 1.3604]
MYIRTKYNGEVEVDANQLFHFDKGIPAFEEEKEFALISLEEGTPFFVLQSIKTADVAFICVDPFPYVHNYKVKLPDSLIDSLQIAKEEDVAIFVFLTIQEPFHETTANLQAPLILNTVTKQGKQFMMSDSTYRTKQPIFQQPAMKGDR